MASAVARQRFTFAEYAALEEMSTVRHEFLEGAVWAMAGGSPQHSGISGNILALLSVQLRDRLCRVFGSDLKVRVKATGLGTYPDVSVVCGQLELDPEDSTGHTVSNPRVLVEVLSPATQEYDCGEKLDHYRRLPSLEEVVLFAHDERRVQIWRRQGDDWVEETVRDDGTAQIRCIDCSLPLPEVYRNPLVQ